MLTPSVFPPRPSTECSTAVVEGLWGPDLNRGISMGFNDVGEIYSEVQALTAMARNLSCSLRKSLTSLLFGSERLPQHSLELTK